MATFDQNKTSAIDSYAQSDQQLNQARNLLGNMGSAVADLNFYRATAIYPQINTFLGYAQTSADIGYNYTNLMKPLADTQQRQADVYSLDQTYFNLTAGINDVRNSSSTLMYQASEGEFTTRTVTQAVDADLVPITTVQPVDVYPVESIPVDAAATLVAEQQRANAENADVQSPGGPGLVFVERNDDSISNVEPISRASNETNADVPVLSVNAELGTDGGSGAISEVGGNRSVLDISAAALQGGVCSAPDDWINQIRTSSGFATSIGLGTGGFFGGGFFGGGFGGAAGGGRPLIPPGFTAPIIATPNRLAALSSQTYSISLYMLTDKENEAIRNGQKVVFPSNSLIIQSGGINSSTVQNQRNKYFDVDFYIDEVELESSIGTQGAGAAHNVTTIKMRLVEPSGITLLDRLDKAVREYAKLGDAPLTATSQNYCMIIRFYGYDTEGKLITGQELGLSSAFFGSDPTAISEKWIPCNIQNIRYSITNKGVEYDLDMTIVQSNTMFSSSFGGGIPFNFELVAPDLKTLFNGSVAYSTDQQTTANATTTTTGTSAAATTTATATNAAATTNTTTTAPQKATAISTTKTVTQGLAEALNQWQNDLVKNGQQEIADQYEIRIANIPGLADATLIKQGTQDKSQAPMQKATDASQRLLMSKNSYDKNTKNFSVTAGTQVVQLIDIAMRASSFITKQQTIVFDQKTQLPIRQQPAATTMWYRIQGISIPLGYDRKRRNTAYKFIYQITPYQINDPRSVYFDPAKYRGVHKIYNYWFTGQNTEVLDFQIDVNYNYFQVVGVDTKVTPAFSGRWAEKRVFQTRPGETGQGGTGTTTMPAATLAERLYTATDVNKCEITIVGDPDWLIQSEVFYLSPTYDAFLADGSVNSGASEVLYEIRFNTPTDFNLSTGLTPTYQNNTSFSSATGSYNVPSQSIVYGANIVKSYFKGGKFTQKISGTIKEFSKGAGSNVLPLTTTTTGFTTRVNNVQPFDTVEYNAVANTIDDAGGAEMTTQQQQQILDYAAYNAVADTIDDGGGVAGTSNQTGTGALTDQSNNPIQVDANNTEVSPSLPSTTNTGMAPDDDAGTAP